MSDVVIKCAVCRALLDEEDLFCPNCGTEAPVSSTARPQTHTSQHFFECQGCGASMTYNAAAGSLHCPFCSSTDMKSAPDQKVLISTGVVPFAVPQQQAEQSMRQWLGSSFWRPGDLAQLAQVTTMVAVYVPYWIFQAQTHTFWTADSSRTPPGARASWYPVFGEHQGTYRGLLVGASGALSAAETTSLSPFDLAYAVPPTQIQFSNVAVEQFGLLRKYARPLARQGIEALERQACAAYVPGSARNLKVNVRISELSSEPMLLPVWIMAYRYRDRVYRFLVNGQTGRATGQAPWSWSKILGAIAIGILILLVIFGIVALVASAH